jgi:uroporphyrinogen-III decarboxylase
LDLWYQANKRAGTLPARYRNRSLEDITEDMGVGFHAVIPDFQDLREPYEDADRALGITNLHSVPVRTVLENVKRTIRSDGDLTRVTYETPVGTVSTTVLYDDEMRKAGITIPHVEECAVKTVEDYRAVGYIFANARVEENYEGYLEYKDRVGERGLTAGFVNAAASPMHLIQRDLMPMETFFFHMYDHPDALEELTEQIAVYWRQMLECAVECPAEVLLLGANYDSAITYPPFFEKHFLPGLKDFADKLHARGKYLLTHTDGENKGLLDLYLRSKIDIADSICPAPMTSLTIEEIRDVFGSNITIMGGIPSIALLPSTMPERDFNAFLDDFFSRIGGGDHLILGIADTTPPAADFKRLLRIGELVNSFGPVTG